MKEIQLVLLLAVAMCRNKTIR